MNFGFDGLTSSGDFAFKAMFPSCLEFQRGFHASTDLRSFVMSNCKCIPQLHRLSLRADPGIPCVMTSEHLAGMLVLGSFTTSLGVDRIFVSKRWPQDCFVKLSPASFHLGNFQWIRGVPGLLDVRLEKNFRGFPRPFGR